MSTIVKIAGLDLTLANLGCARFTIDLSNLKLQLEHLELIQTAAAEGKGVFKNADDLRRAREVYAGVDRCLEGCSIVCAEIPTGSQSSRASFSFGVAHGILSTLPLPLIQVQPVDAKVAATGSKTASKADMISWAYGLYPEGPWLRFRGQKAGRLLATNEHMADACAIVHAGLLKPAFAGLQTALLNPVRQPDA